jgi:hypothetical protein
LFYLYDPRTNILTETNYDYIHDLTGIKINTLRCNKSSGRKIRSINCYITDENVTVQQRKEWYEKEKYPDENWKVIHGSDEKFLISNYGRFKRVYKRHTSFLLPFYYKQKFLQIKVKFKGVYENHKIANLVAYHFVGKPKDGEVIYHKNGIKTDDFAGNLEIITKEKLGKKTGFKSKSKAVVQLDRFTGEFLGEFRSAREAGRQDLLLKVIGNVEEKNVRQTGDNGIAQAVTIKTGVATADDVLVPNPVSLAPFRTFLEVEQPISDFIFRMKDGPKGAIFEADGGAWRNQAISNVREYLEVELFAEVELGKITIIA